MLHAPTAAVDPPSLPPGEVRLVDGRGELFVRRGPGSPERIPVLLVHGWQATADLNFFALYEPLAARRPVIAADLRGHGRSFYPTEPFRLEDAADDNAALLRELGVARAVVVGFSIGSAVTQLLAARHPDLVAGIVLVGGELAPDARPHEKLYLRAAGWQGTALRLSTGRWSAHRAVDKATRTAPGTEQLREWVVGEAERGHAGSIRAAGRALAGFDGRPLATSSDVPAVVVVTTRDRVVRASRQRALAAAWHADVVELAAGHDAPLAHPAAFVEAIAEAVERVT